MSDRRCNKIRELREHAGLTQSQLADKAGLGRPSLARAENPEASPRLPTLRKIAMALGTSIDDLICV